MASTGRRAGILVAIVLVLAQASRPAGADALDQGARLAALAKVWGLLKYFHPGVAQGTMNWDTSLIDELPRIQAADSRDGLQRRDRAVHSVGRRSAARDRRRSARNT